MVGAPDSWEPTISIVNRDHEYVSCIWSPCGRFIAAQAGNVVEIRNQLTLELLTILQPADATRRPTSPLAYSPDGRSLASAFGTAIIIWDIQTGGVAKKIECTANCVSLEWSLGGKTICAIHNRWEGPSSVHVYDVASGTTQVAGRVYARRKPSLFAYGESFLVVGGAVGHDEIDVFKVERTLVRVPLVRVMDRLGSYEPSTLFPVNPHISVSSDNTPVVIYPPPEPSLWIENQSLSSCFSPDGSLFAAFTGGNLHTLQERGKTPSSRGVVVPINGMKPDVPSMVWKEIRVHGMVNPAFRFSPTTASILGYSENILQVWRLPEPPTKPRTHASRCVSLSRSGYRAASAHKLTTTVTVANLQAPPQYIVTGMVVEGLALTGNVLLVVDREKIVAWLLTKEGSVGGVFGRVSHGPHGSGDRVWTVALQGHHKSLSFSVEGQVGIIRSATHTWPRAYNTETGELLDHPTQNPSGRWYKFSDVHCGRHHSHLHNLPQYDGSLNGGPQVSWDASREGWIKDSEGRCMLWLPVEWRTSWDRADWLPRIATQCSIIGGQPVIVKF